MHCLYDGSVRISYSFKDIVILSYNYIFKPGALGNITMQAFLNDPGLKAGLVAEVRKYREQNRTTKGCSVACSIHALNTLCGTEYDTSDHAVYEAFGVPGWLGRVQDILFEGLPKPRNVFFPEHLLSAIPVGADLNRIKLPFMLNVLRSSSKAAAISMTLNVPGDPSETAWALVRVCASVAAQTLIEVPLTYAKATTAQALAAAERRAVKRERWATEKAYVYVAEKLLKLLELEAT